MTQRKTLVPLAAAFLTLFFFTGCGGGGEADSGTQEATQEEAAVVPAGTATVSGTVQFEGTPPERVPIEQKRECDVLHEEPILSQNVVVNDNGTLKWVFVSVKEGLGDQDFPAPEEPVVLTQENCMYHPHVFGVQAGQPINIVNGDPLQHNIHALPEENRPFNFSQPVEGMEREAQFMQAEVMVRIKCDVHPWMQAWAGVVDHPYYSTTGDDGTFSLENLPAGEYVVEAWHETYGRKTQSVTVAEGETETVDFMFSAEGATS